ncbi:uncharacterized protein M437DRAFT_39544 [Aureobasidium melanogenum CBS 110374]|uniref:Uncharacterized protein n=1 Tax=Aureobasidium melanogenum (strain CBS 110374) TaxID=1043003 RepID=A0A074W0L6_AURM1|nr:uncharacterized protein M437DRAFT_39544 [Aureobasidium melanogenum CBS 110374]KEQ66595.1 hypothetical protein M437DRAFT_39544 [Aureobasidium melanogenum CBS 110374]
MAIATRLSPKAMTTLGVMAFVTLCFQTFNSSALPSLDATTLARLDAIERQIATLNHILAETNSTVPLNLTFPTRSSPDTSLAEVTKMVFGIAAILAWAASMSIFFEEVGKAASRTFAMGIWTACVTFVGLWYFGEPREWYGYFLGANWGFIGAVFLAVVFDRRDGGVDRLKEAVVDGQKA